MAGMTTTTTDPLSGFAALGPTDLRDARRRRPGADLSGYAAERGLETLGSATAAGYLAAMPGDEALQFNVLRGMLPGGAHGILFHHRHAWPVDGQGRAAGTFYGKLYSSGGSFKDMLRPHPWAVLSGLPYVGWLFDLAGPSRVSGDGRRQRLLSGPVLARLRAAGELPYFRLELSHGTVVVETNGYLDDARRLDRLAETLSVAAAEVRDACRGLANERPFADALPPVRM
jgi:hypothetical protein